MDFLKAFPIAIIDEDFQIIAIFNAESQPGLAGARLPPADEASNGGVRDTARDRADKWGVRSSRGIVENQSI